jgi:predicted dehydrogenase
MLTAAFLGCGPRAAEVHTAFQHVRLCRVAACCDNNAERMKSFIAERNISGGYTDLTQMLRDVRPDVLFLIAPPNVRWPVVETVLKNPPRALVIEKPLANLPSEAERILQECSAARVPVFINHQMRHQPVWIGLKSVLDSGRLGALRHIRASFKGNLLEQGTHLFDAISFLFNDNLEIDWVCAQASGATGFQKSHSAPDFVNGSMALRGAGAHLSFEFGDRAPDWPGADNFWLRFGCEFYGERGYAGCSLNRGWWCSIDGQARFEPNNYYADDIQAQARFIDSICEKVSSRATTDGHARARWPFQITMSILRSAALRQPVSPTDLCTDEDIEALKCGLRGSSEPARTGAAH